MDPSINISRNGLMARQKFARKMLDSLRNFSPVLLLVTFAFAFVVHSIVTAKKIKPATTQRLGPGGRPLPKRMRSTPLVSTSGSQDFSPNAKLVFKWLTVGVMFTFLVDAAVNVVHIILYRDTKWWCGQATVVSHPTLLPSVKPV
jgi:hypothetical protein